MIEHFVCILKSSILLGAVIICCGRDFLNFYRSYELTIVSSILEMYWSSSSDVEY